MGILVDGVRVCLFASALVGCDGVFNLDHVSAPPDVPPNDLGCATKPALLCADFEHGNTYYANGIVTDVPMSGGTAAVTIETPGANGGHALYVDTTGDTYSIDVSSTTAASRINATFDLDLARFVSTSSATALAVLDFPQTQAPSCYVALNFEATPPRLVLIEHCTSEAYPDLLMPLPSSSTFVPVRFELDLKMTTASIQIGGNAPVVVGIDPGGSTTSTPHVRLGIIDQQSGAGARVAFDNVFVVTAAK